MTWKLTDLELIDHKFGLYCLGNQHHFHEIGVYLDVYMYLLHFWVDTWKSVVLYPTDARASVGSRWFLGCLLPKHTS